MGSVLRLILSTALVAVSGLSLAGCMAKNESDKSKDTRIGTAEEPAPPQGSGTIEASYSAIRAKIFGPKCGSCHSAGTRAQFLRLDSLPALRMYPGFVTDNPDESILLGRLTRTDAGRMPPPETGAAALSRQEIAVLRAWIASGAPE